MRNYRTVPLRLDMPTTELEHFKPEDFRCSCCGVDMTKPILKITLQAFRYFLVDYLGRQEPIIVECGYRCPEHNKALEADPNYLASPTSQHMEGLAVDFRTTKLSVENLYGVMKKFPLWRTVYWYPDRGIVHGDCRHRVGPQFFKRIEG